MTTDSATSPRERIRHHARKLLAASSLIGVALTAPGCGSTVVDPAPPPFCQPDQMLESHQLSVSAHWEKDSADEWVASLVIVATRYMAFPADPATTGGAIESLSRTGDRVEFILRPLAIPSTAHVTLPLSCDTGEARDFRFSLDLSAPSAGMAISVREDSAS